jgi:capsular polysaccharide biosynthesis protein
MPPAESTVALAEGTVLLLSPFRVSPAAVHSRHVEPRAGNDQRLEQLDLAGVAAVARRRPWALLAGALAGVALVMLAAGSARAGYQATVKLLVGPIGGSYSELRAASRQGQTYADLATSEPVLQASRAQLGAHPAVAPPAGVSAKADYFTRLLTITAQERTRDAATAMATAVADELRRVTRARGPAGGGQLSPVGPLEVSRAGSGRKTKTLAAVAALTGFLAALTLLVSIELRRGPRGRARGLAMGPT